MSSPIDNYRNYLARNYSDMKLPAGKPYGVIKLVKGYDFGFHVRKDHVSVHFISNGTHDPEEVMGYINDNGIGDKTYGDGLEPDVFRGTRNAAVVRCEVHIPLESVDELRKPTLRKHSQRIFDELYDDFSGIAGVEMPKPKEDTAETVEETDDMAMDNENEEEKESKSGENHLVEGDTVVVIKKFNTDDKEETPLVIGTKLQVQEIDADGDANMKLLHGDWTCWIFSSNFKNLKKIDKNDKTDYYEKDQENVEMPKPEEDTAGKNEKKTGTLKIVIEGKMHQFKLGILQDELREGLEEVIKYLDDYDTVENLIGALWYGIPSEIFEPIPKESWDQIASDYPVIEKIQGTTMGGVWDEFWIFYEPWVIDNDNYITIYIDDEILVAGEVGSLFEKTCDPGYERDDVKEILGIDLTPQEVMGKINCKVSHPFEWDEEIAETIGDKEEFGSDHTFDLSKYGWQLGTIRHSVFRQKIKEVEYGTNRMQVTEYGKYKIVSDEIDLENFDWQRLVFLRNSTIWDFVPNQKEYALSHVLYAFEDGELEELFFTIHDFSILDVSCNYTWPTDE